MSRESLNLKRFGRSIYAFDLGLDLFGLIDQHLTFVIQFAFVPVRPMEQVHFTGRWVGRQGRGYRFVVGSSLVSSGFRNFSLGMCHRNLFIR